MNGGFRQSMTWLHTWSGLVFCWILYFMFVTGTLGYFDTEIDRWMQPERPSAAEEVPLATSLPVAQGYLEREAEGADRWVLAPAHGREELELRVFFQMPAVEDGAEGADERPRRGNEDLDLRTGEPLAEPERATGGGQTLYRMHYLLHYFPDQTGYRLVAIITLLMFVAMVSGIIIHKKIFKDLFTLRLRRGQRSWLDAHNLLSVSSLPFQLMITYSGLVFTVGLWMPMIAFASYGFDHEEADTVLEEVVGDIRVERSGEAAPLADLVAIAEDAEREWGPGQMRLLEVRMPGDANATVFASRRGGLSALPERLVYDGTTGERLQSLPAHANAPVAFAATLVGLHEGHFAGPILRWLYIFSGLLGTAMVATGAVYWTAKRKKTTGKPESRGYRFVDAVNVGTIIGLPVGIAAYFLANRLLPIGMEGRAAWEVHCMFIVWALCLLYPVVRPRAKAWREQAWLAAAACGAIPVVNALTTDAHLGNSLAAGDWVLAGFDLSAIAAAAGFAVLALTLGRAARTPEPEAAPLPAGDEVTAP